MPMPSIMGGQGLGPARRTVSTTKRLTPSTPSAGLSILRRLMFSLPKPLGATVMVQPSPSTRCTVMAAGGVVAGVAPAQGVGHDALAQIAIGVAAADSLVDGGFKAAIDVDVGAKLHKDAGHASILTDGQVFSLCGARFDQSRSRVVLASGQGSSCRALSSAACTSCGRRVLALMHSRATVSVISPVRRWFSCLYPPLYSRATPVSRAAFATAAATASATRGSKAPGMMFSSLRSSSVIRSAMA